MHEDLLARIRNGQALSFAQKIKLVITLSMPSIMAQLTSIIMQYIDAAMVCRLGANASASIGVVASSTWLFSGLCVAVIAGFSIQVAHYIGAKEFDRAKEVLCHSYFVVLGMAVLIAAIGIAISGSLPAWLGSDAAIRQDASGYFLIYRTPMLKIDHSVKFRLNPIYLKKAARLSVPIACERFIMSGALVITTGIVAPLGAIATAANSLAVTAESLCYMPGYGIGDAATTLIGQSVGARRKDMCRSFSRITVVFAMGFMAATAVLLYIFAPFLMGMLSTDPEVCVGHTHTAY